MPDEPIFNLDLTGADGKKIPFKFTQSAMRDLLVTMLTTVGSAPPDTADEFKLDKFPIPCNGFMVTPLAGVPHGAHVTIGVGPMNLQFGIALDALVMALEDIRAMTGPRPASSRTLS